MDFSLGYRFFDDGSDTIYQIVKDFKGKISDVYFAFGSEASGRHALCEASDTDSLHYQIEELSEISKLNCSLTLLFNASCYGKDAMSTALEKRVTGCIETLSKNMKISKVTTTSVFVASIVKKYFPHIKTCASVNMRIGSIKAFSQLEEYFDAFYMQREFNRDFNKIKELSSWCSAHGKQLDLLANSGCLHSCAYQSYHDNLVSHESEIDYSSLSKLAISAPCHKYLSKMDIYDAAAVFLSNTWILPSELYRYEKYFSSAKLATRLHTNPRAVANAYVNREKYVDIFSLTEPNYNDIFGGYIFDSSKLCDNWFDFLLNCDKNCHACGRCKEIAKKALVKLY